MKLQSLPTFLVRRKNWLLMAALALSLTAALLLRPSSPQAQRVTIVTEKQEITEQDTALVLTLVQVHTGVPASGVRIMTAQ